jgi:hypothetical protein
MRFNDEALLDASASNVDDHRTLPYIDSIWWTNTPADGVTSSIDSFMELTIAMTGCVVGIAIGVVMIAAAFRPR